jgi:serine/threonine protein kinase
VSGFTAQLDRCPTCTGALASGAWCPRCALEEVLQNPHAPLPTSEASVVIGDHLILGELGRGAAGIVYRARQENPSREVAMKILRPHEAASPDSRARFRAEAATVAQLDHPAILPVFDVGEHDGLPYFTMKLCAGGSLAERMAPYRNAPRDVATLVATLADALAHAHERGVLHRDLKPANVLFDEAGRAFLSDFGLAKSARGAHPGRALTQPLAVLGTPGYTAPEVLAQGGATATPAADVYGLGALLYELLTGAAPEPVARGHSSEFPRAVPPGLAAIAERCLQAEPAKRYPSAGALRDELRGWLDQPVEAVDAPARVESRHRGRRPVELIVLGVFLAAAMLALAWLTRDHVQHRAAVSARRTWNSGRDFSSERNPNGDWRYGYITRLGAELVLFQESTTNRNWLEYWQSPLGLDPNVSHNAHDRPIDVLRNFILPPGKMAFHPGPHGELSVCRWTAPHAGNFSIRAQFVGLGRNATTDVYVLLNGVEIYRGDLNAPDEKQECSLQRSLRAADIVDFAVGFGRDQNYQSDTTGLDATVQELDPTA